MTNVDSLLAQSAPARVLLVNALDDARSQDPPRRQNSSIEGAAVIVARRALLDTARTLQSPSPMQSANALLVEPVQASSESVSLYPKYGQAKLSGRSSSATIYLNQATTKDRSLVDPLKQQFIGPCNVLWAVLGEQPLATSSCSEWRIEIEAHHAFAQSRGWPWTR